MGVVREYRVRGEGRMRYVCMYVCVDRGEGNKGRVRVRGVRLSHTTNRTSLKSSPNVMKEKRKGKK